MFLRRPRSHFITGFLGAYTNHSARATNVDIFVALWRHDHQHLRARRESRAQVRLRGIAAIGMIMYEDQVESLKGFDLVILQAYILQTVSA